MKTYSGFLFILLLIMAVVFTACNDDDSGGGPAAADPVVHTILSASNVTNGMIGLAIKDQIVLAAFVSGDTKLLNLYRSSDSGDTFAFVDSTDHSLFAATPAVRAAITDDDTLYIAYRQFDFDNGGHHIGIVQVDDALTASDFTIDSLALSGTSICTGNMDVINYANTLFVPFTDTSPYSAKFLNVDFTSASIIDSLTRTANEGGIAGIAQSDTKWKTAYVNSDGVDSTILCARTADSGSNWGVPVQVTDETGYVENVDIFAENDFVIISYYTGNNVYTRYSTDNGDTWSVEELVSAAYDDMTSLAKSTVYLNLVFSRNNGKDLCLARSSNNGVSWTVTVLVDEISSGTKYPEIQASGNTICIAYCSGEGIFLLKSANDGLTWD